MDNAELAPFIKGWERAGLSEEQIAKRVERHLRLAERDDADEADASLLDEDLSQLSEDDAQPITSPEMRAAIDAGMQMMADPGNEPKQTREPPQYRVPFVGGPRLDVNDPSVRRELERYRPLALREIAEQKPPQWLVSRHIPENSLVELFGEYSSCKSFLAIDWSLSIATGTPWLGRKVQQGHVVYVYAEGTQGLKKRMLAWCKEHGLDELPETFHAIPRAINMRDLNGALAYAALAIKLALKDKKPRLIVLDTLNRCFGGGEENSNKDMSDFITACEKLQETFGATVLVVHHSGKDRAKGGRGASAFGGAMDVIFELVKKDRDQPLAVLLNNTATTKPHKDSSPLPDLALDFVEIPLDIEPVEDDPHSTTSLVVRLANADAIQTMTAEKPSKRELYLARMFRALTGFGEGGAKNSEWLRDCGVPKSTFQTLIKELVETGDVKRAEDGRYFAVGAEALDTDELMDENLDEL